MDDPDQDLGNSSGDHALARALIDQFVCCNAEHALVALDPRGVVIGWYGAAQRILGYSAQEILGRPVGVLFTDDDLQRGLDDYELSVASDGGTAHDDRWHVRKDGAHIWVNGTVTAVCNPDGSIAGYVKLLRDRTDLKTQLDSQQQQFEASAADLRSRDLVLGTLGHELRNPLSVIVTATALLAGRQDRDEVTDRAVRLLERQTQLLQRLADDLMDVTRTMRGKVQLDLERLDLTVAVAQSVREFEARFQAKSVALVQTVPRTPIWVQADAARLQQIIANLLDNALKYTPKGGTVWVKCSSDGQHALLMVEDTGVGIMPDMLPRIFELFTQETRSTSLARGGVGIGLALVKEFAQLHGGNVEARSAGEGKGSEFTVRFPLSMA
ncbi:PAS domain-containing sensor histidine kinase [Roseateles asaccharophilus]|uniref:histidine kinase n=1 Tax=Roseateles asaccharophilus TaxID=582607 RepID=A0ABU2A6G6_9BURK|nr:PAS domain-containing sensor histidine kinase [Roseateles asaccharophilus]MDR7332725.1 PAS domain S-box-containing protein [Roseateles asaccharophilus]